MALTDFTYKRSYNPDNCDNLLDAFYRPALQEAVSYDRTTFTFSPRALAAVGRGLERFLLSDGRIRLICNHELNAQVKQAIDNGQQSAEDVISELIPPESLVDLSNIQPEQKQALDLLTWLVAQDRIEIKIALIAKGRLIFHEKEGILTDAVGNRVAFGGSTNETFAAWSENYENINVFTDWLEPDRVDDAQAHFDLLWENKSRSAIVLPVSEAHIEQLKRMSPLETPVSSSGPNPNEYWHPIAQHLLQTPETSIATAPLSLWPHQQAFFVKHALNNEEPVRKLIADEVGLGKTLQAASILKWRINQKKARRFLIITPAGSRFQWQDELRDRLNINVPVMERRQRQVILIHPDGNETPAPSDYWMQSHAIVSYHWARSDRTRLLQAAEQSPYDHIIVDEAHHARYSSPESERRRSPNQYLNLLQGLSHHTRDLLLLTATPMQTATADLWALVNLLEPDTWDYKDFETLYNPGISDDRHLWYLAREAYRRNESCPKTLTDDAESIVWADNDTWVHNRLNSNIMRKSATYMRKRGPVARNMSRHTRSLLDEYRKLGYDTGVPTRVVRDIAIPMNAQERELYHNVKPLIKSIYENRSQVNRTAIGFTTTVFHTRLASSPNAYASSLQSIIDKRFEQAQDANAEAELTWNDFADLSDEEVDDLASGENTPPPITLTPDQVSDIRWNILKAQDLANADTKIDELRTALDNLERRGHRLIIIFTQYRDTQTWLEDNLASDWQLTCLHGADKNQYSETRAQRLQWLQEQDKGLLLCTESASESLNLQFCSALINYDIPWNPMKLEQRIGRIDRIGQRADSIDIINLFYEDTAQWRAYKAVERRLNDITHSVGPYRPILNSRTPSVIKTIIDNNLTEEEIDNVLRAVTNEPAPNIDDFHTTNVIDLSGNSPVDSEYIHSLLANSILPGEWQAKPEGEGHYRVTLPNGTSDVTTADREKYDPDLEAWFGPGSAVFDQTLTHYSEISS